jgi:hypothetical protein
MTALIVLRNKAVKPLLAAAQPLRPTHGAHNPKPIDAHYDALQLAMRRVFHDLGIAARASTKLLSGFALKRLTA